MIAANGGTSRWIVYPLLASLALAVGIFPMVNERPASPRDPFGLAVGIAGERYATQSELLRRAHSRELARAAIAQTARTVEPFVFVRPADAPMAFQERVQAIIQPSFTLPRRDPHMRVVVALTVDTGSTVAGAIVQKLFRTVRADVFPPGSIADGVCTIVVRAGHRRMLTPSRRGERPFYYVRRDIAAPCSWYAAYGSPGRGVANWLDSTHFAAIAAGRSGRYSYGYSNRLEQLAIPACWAGREQACAALILRPLDRQEFDWYPAPIYTPGWIGGTRWGDAPSNGFATSMLLGLEREIGTEGFATFWKSDQPLSVAFAAARGESLDAWTRRLLRRGSAVYPAGPLPAPRLSIAWLIAVPGLLALGVLGVAKRGEFA